MEEEFDFGTISGEASFFEAKKRYIDFILNLCI